MEENNKDEKKVWYKRLYEKAKNFVQNIVKKDLSEEQEESANIETNLNNSDSKNNMDKLKSLTKTFEPRTIPVHEQMEELYEEGPDLDL